MSDFDVRQIVLSTDDLDESIRFYTETLGFRLKFQRRAVVYDNKGNGLVFYSPLPK